MTLRRFRAGQALTSLRDPLNAIVEEVRNSGPRRPKPNATNISQIRELEIKTLNTDDLTCVDPGESANVDAAEYTVKLPLTFTEAARDGISYTYTDINNRTADGTESQQLTPSYVVGDFIVVMRLRSNADSGWYHRDLNVDGRQWAKVP